MNGKVTPVYRERTWNEDEESMTGSSRISKGVIFCALTGKPIADGQCEYAKKSSPIILSVYKDRQGIWTQAWPHHVEGNPQRVGAITDTHVVETMEERWEDARAEIMQDSVKDKKVVTPPLKKVRYEAEEVMKGIRKAPSTKCPPAIRVGDEQVPVKAPPRPLLVKHAPEYGNRHHLDLMRGEKLRRLGC